MLPPLCVTYDNITQADIDHNQQNMAQAWNPPTPIEYLFKQLCVGHKITMEVSDSLSAPQLVRLGYNIIHKTGLFGTAFRE